MRTHASRRYYNIVSCKIKVILRYLWPDDYIFMLFGPFFFRFFRFYGVTMSFFLWFYSF
ncbi:hypothetical protein BACCAP_00306 [Pseudoflavonifractor capillosus ATCC 29799]|uniref:Uncharacterized protein n=1 Tax=Pseudoflavonifractor capillosus ATCC 29799 TaxID=411467 RepID=A6NQ37_9FIRM|nr:hypothetical protein BACCAP_00306 [Pseudoflavonifractor capillosus ATCC 29799]